MKKKATERTRPADRETVGGSRALGKAGGVRAPTKRRRPKKKPPAGKEEPAGGGGRAVTEEPSASRVSQDLAAERKRDRGGSSKAKAKAGGDRVKSKTNAPTKTKTKPKAEAKAKTRAKVQAKSTVKAKIRSRPDGRVPAPAPTKKKPGKRRLSRTRAAILARRRRREERGILDQLTYEREERRARANERRREKRRPGPPDERRIAIGWLEDIRKIVARVFPCSLDVTEAVSSSKGDEEDDVPGAVRQRENMRTPWLVVGRFDPQAPIGYAELAQALFTVQRNLILEARINPQRLSQIRVVYADPNGRRGEGDSVVSKIGAWEFILSDVVTEIMGSRDDDPDALVARYKDTKIPKFYLYFSTNTSVHVTGWGRAFAWAKV